MKVAVFDSDSDSDTDEIDEILVHFSFCIQQDPLYNGGLEG